jgi:hypothetical protein
MIYPKYIRDGPPRQLAAWDRHPKLEPGLADASLIVLAARHRVRDILTLDRRHFDVMRQLNGRPFRLWPWGPASSHRRELLAVDRRGGG